MFKDLLKKDLNTFFNISEFAETHLIEGNHVDVIIDNDRLEERSKKEYEGIYVGDLLYFAKIENFLKPPIVDELQRFDGKIYTVFDVRKAHNMYEIILKRNGS